MQKIAWWSVLVSYVESNARFLGTGHADIRRWNLASMDIGWINQGRGDCPSDKGF